MGASFSLKRGNAALLILEKINLTGYINRFALRPVDHPRLPAVCDNVSKHSLIVGSIEINTVLMNKSQEEEINPRVMFNDEAENLRGRSKERSVDANQLPVQ